MSIKQLNELSLASFRGGRISDYTQFWKTITFDREVLSIVSGMKIPLMDSNIERQSCRQIPFNISEKELINVEIQKMLKKGVIIPVSNKPEPGEFISPIFCRPKKSGGVRIILNLKDFNFEVEKKHFKMQTLQTAIDLMKKDAYMASIDFKDAYYSIPIHPDHQKYLRFWWNGQKYQFGCLPNGLSNGPRHFTKVTKALFRPLRKRGYTLTTYIDDNFSIEQLFERCLENVLETATISLKAGFVINWEKSVIIPTQKLVYLGFLLDTVEMKITLTADKCSSLKNQISKFLQSNQITILALSQIVGKLVASFPGVRFGRLFYRQLDIEKTRALKFNHGNFDSTMDLSERARADLNWWLNNLDSSFQYASSRSPTVTITCDACNTGWGGWSGSSETKGKFSVQESSLHINEKELLAVLFSLQSLLTQTRNQVIKVLSDNAVTVSYINNMGGRIQRCYDIARQIWEWAIARDNWIISSHIPGKKNTQADALSRALTVNTEWSLHSQIFDAILNRYPRLEIDLFASRLNFKLNKYVSWLPDPGATFCDAFSIHWGPFFAYAFPPFALIGKVLKKVQEDGATMVIVVPDWPTSPWYSRLLEMSIETPFFIPGTRPRLTNPMQGDRLRAGLIVSCIRASNNHPRLRTLSTNHGAVQPDSSTTHTFANGAFFVKNGVWTPFRRL